MSSGTISIVLNSLDGREMVINEMQRGDLFGELGILTKKPRSTLAKLGRRKPVNVGSRLTDRRAQGVVATSSTLIDI